MDDAVPRFTNGFPDEVVMATFFPFANVYAKDVKVVLFATRVSPKDAVNAYSG